MIVGPSAHSTLAATHKLMVTDALIKVNDDEVQSDSKGVSILVSIGWDTDCGNCQAYIYP